MSKLSDIVKNDVVKKALYYKLATKVNHVDTSDFALKIKFQTGKNELENKIQDVITLATRTVLSAVKNEIPNVK